MIQFSDEYKQFRMINELGLPETVTETPFYEGLTDVECDVWGIPRRNQFPFGVEYK